MRRVSQKLSPSLNGLSPPSLRHDERMTMRCLLARPVLRSQSHLTTLKKTRAAERGERPGGAVRLCPPSLRALPKQPRTSSARFARISETRSGPAASERPGPWRHGGGGGLSRGSSWQGSRRWARPHWSLCVKVIRETEGPKMDPPGDPLKIHRAN